MTLISMSISTQGFVMTLSRVSESSAPPNETCNFGASSWLEGLDDGGSHNFAGLANASSVNSKSARVVRLFVIEVARVSSLCCHHCPMPMTFQHLSICVEFHRPQAVSYERGKNYRQANVFFRPILTLIPCSHARQPCTFGLVFFIFASAL